jgi:hypothetical protein
MVNRRAKLTIVGLADTDASPEEAAAVIAAVQRFMRDTAPVPVSAPSPPNPWQQAALREGVDRAPQAPLAWL